jgi:hypothetical protein
VNQTRVGSLIEAAMNTVIGFVVSLIAMPFILPVFDIHPSASTNLGIVSIFTVISVARGYVVRRFFNAWLRRTSKRLAYFASGKAAQDDAIARGCENCVVILSEIRRGEVGRRCAHCGTKWLNRKYTKAVSHGVE